MALLLTMVLSQSSRWIYYPDPVMGLVPLAETQLKACGIYPPDVVMNQVTVLKIVCTMETKQQVTMIKDIPPVELFLQILT